MAEKTCFALQGIKRKDAADWRKMLANSGEYLEHLSSATYESYMSSDCDDLWEEANENDRGQWASNMAYLITEDDKREIKHYDIYNVMHVLRNFPVAAAMDARGEWVELEDIAGYCDECEGAMDDTCLFTVEGVAVYQCLCGAEVVMVDRDWKRPLAWPPGAPWPPRRSFAGEPLDVHPEEDD